MLSRQNSAVELERIYTPLELPEYFASIRMTRAGRNFRCKATTLMPPVHSGEILDFMKPLELTVNRLALDLHVPATRIGEIVYERRRITADTALRLVRYFKTNSEFWLNPQNFFDLEIERRSGAVVEIERHVHPAAAPAS